MKHHFCLEKYKLELHWDRVEYNTDTIAKLINARFSGPALKIAQKINVPDTIDLDLTPQHLAVLDSYYIVKLVWDKVEYLKDGSVSLGNAVISNGLLKSLHKLGDKDHIVINTQKHEEKTHAFNLVYESEVVRQDNEPYKYDKK